MAFDLCVITDTESNLYIDSTSNRIAHDQSSGADVDYRTLSIGQGKYSTLHNGGRASKAAKGEVIA